MLGNIRKLNQGGIQVVGNFKQERERERGKGKIKSVSDVNLIYFMHSLILI